jgi:hypothetical protein
MRRSQENRIIAAVIRCYPVRWRSRHGAEATLVASALLQDGTPWWSIVGSFLGGVVRERAFHVTRTRISAAMAAVILGIAAAPLALFASLTPASASGTDVSIVVSKPGDAARQLESAFASHHFRIVIVKRPVTSDVVGAILSVSTMRQSSDKAGTISEIRGRCNSGRSGCVVGLVMPSHFSGIVRVTVGVATTAEMRSAR